MNPLNQVQFLCNVASDPAISEPNAVLAAAVLITFVNHHIGQCDPSIETLGERMRRGEEAVRKGLKALEDAGHIEIRRRWNSSNRYFLLLKTPPGSTPPPPPENQAPAPPKIEDRPPENGGSPPSENRALTGIDSNLLPVSEGTATMRQIQWLVKRWQQLADKPGWKMCKAFAAVVGAIKRVGFDAVAHLYAQLEGGGKRAGWWLERELRELMPLSVPQPAPVEAEGSATADAPDLDTLPVEALAQIRTARMMVSDAVCNIPLWLRIQAAIEAVGLKPAMLYDREKCERQLAFAMGRGQTVRT